MTERFILQREQLDDLNWATKSVADCDQQDCQSVAVNMIQSLSEHGTSSLVRRTASTAAGTAMSFCSSCPKFVEMLCSSVRLHESRRY
jgi:hypothetical protein